MTVSGEAKAIELTPDDLVFVTNGSITESSTYGSHHEVAKPTKALGGSWNLWENLAAQSDDFGHPKVFYQDLPAESWFVSATATIKHPAIEPYIERLTHRDLHDGKVNTGGIITITDSNWMMSFAIHRQPHFKEQKKMRPLSGFTVFIPIVRAITSTRKLRSVQVKKSQKNGCTTLGYLLIKSRT